MPGRVGVSIREARLLRFERTIQFLLIVYPILLTSVKGGMSSCFVVLFVLSISRVFAVDAMPLCIWQRQDLFYAASMAALMIAVLASQVHHGQLALSTLDEASRFLLAIPIYLTLRTVRVSALTAVEWGIPLGALAGLLTMTVFPSRDFVSATYFVDPIHFDQLMLMLGLLSIATINWRRTDSASVLVLKLAGFMSGIYCAAQYSRGVWLATPILVVLLAHYRLAGVRRAKLLSLAAVSATLLLAYFLVPEFHARIEASRNEMLALLAGRFDTSLGIRLQIWGALIEIIKQHPIAGVGPDGLYGALQAMYARGVIGERVLGYALAESHNEILAHTAKLGVLGLISILAIFFVPMILFVRSISSASEPIARTAAVLGVLVTLGYFVFGLTVEVFDLKMIAAFYAVTVAVFLAIVRTTPLRPEEPMGTAEELRRAGG